MNRKDYDSNQTYTRIHRIRIQRAKDSTTVITGESKEVELEGAPGSTPGASSVYPY